MENKPKSASWFGDVCQKFEALCFDDMAWQEGLKFVEDQVQTVGVNVMQFFSEFVPESSVVEDAVCDSSVTKSSDEVFKMSKKGVLEDFSDKDPCRENNFLDTLSREPNKVAEQYLPLDYHVDLCEDLAMSVENPSQAKQHDLELSDKITNENEDPNNTLLSPVANKLVTSKVVLPDVSSSNSAVLANSCDTEVLYVKLSVDDSPTGLMRNDVPVNEDSLSESSHKTKLDESCILVYGTDFSEISSVSFEAGRSKPYKDKFGASFFSKRRSRKQDCGSQLDSRVIQEKGVGEAVATSSITSTSNQEYYDSDWEIV